MRYGWKGDFRGIYDVERDITEVGFDDDFEPLKFWLACHVKIKGLRRKIPQGHRLPIKSMKCSLA